MRENESASSHLCSNTLSSVLLLSMSASCDGSMQVLWTAPAGSPSSFPCVDCGLVTGNFCDGGAALDFKDACFACNSDPVSYPDISSQRTPLCSYCETLYGYCRFCRNVSGCTPPATKTHWSGDPRELGISSGREFTAETRDRAILMQRLSSQTRQTVADCRVGDDGDAARNETSKK